MPLALGSCAETLLAIADINISICANIDLSICADIDLSICADVYLSICADIDLSICVPQCMEGLEGRISYLWSKQGWTCAEN